MTQTESARLDQDATMQVNAIRGPVKGIFLKKLESDGLKYLGCSLSHSFSLDLDNKLLCSQRP